MPGPYSNPFQPMVPASAIKPIQDAIDSPSLNRSPTEARIRGFGAGALEGLRGLTSPISLLSAAAGPLSGAGAGASAATPAFDLVESGANVKQAMPTSSDVDALQGLLKYNLAKVPTSRALAPATAGVSPGAEFVPQGGESAFNALRQAAQPLTDPLEKAYRALLMRGGQ